MTVLQQALHGIQAWMDETFKPAKTRLREEGTPNVYRFEVEQGAPSPTLVISQEVFDHHPVDEIIAALDHDHVAARLRSDPITPLMSVEPQGRIIFVPPHRWRRSQTELETRR
jgi:hypothetical protein